VTSIECKNLDSVLQTKIKTVTGFEVSKGNSLQQVQEHRL